MLTFAEKIVGIENVQTPPPLLAEAKNLRNQDFPNPSTHTYRDIKCYKTVTGIATRGEGVKHLGSATLRN